MIKMTIENLLTWAFTQELWKVGSGGAGVDIPLSAWSMVQSYAEVGTLIDRSPNQYGVLPGFEDDVIAHPDAILAGEAVRCLARSGGFDIAKGWQPFPEWDDEHGLIAAEVSYALDEVLLNSPATQARQVANLVMSCAVLGRGPLWEADCPAAEEITRNGKPLWFVKKKARDLMGRVYEYETDGYDRKRKVPKRGAYRKYRLAFSVRGAAISRLEWQVWRDALEHLHSDLQGRLSGHSLLPFKADRTPWISEKSFGLKLSA